MTQEARNRAPFELLRFTATAVSADVVLVELEGRFSQRGRFARRPLLVIDDEDHGRVELAPVRALADGDSWRGAYAAPLGAPGTQRFALGVRGTLLDLPEPDVADDGERLAALARETNALRRALERAETDAAARVEEAETRAAARVEAADGEAAGRAEAAEAEAAARAEAAEAEAAASAERAERSTAEARRIAAAAEQEAEETIAREVEAVEQSAQDAEGRAAAAEQAASAAEQAVSAAEAGAEVLRAELAEERERAQGAIGELQERLEEAHATERDLRRQLRAARGELEARRREAARPRRPDRAAGDAGAAPDDADDDATRVLPAADEPATAVPPAADQTQPMGTVRDVADDPDEEDDGAYEHDAPPAFESVRVIGREPRHVDPHPRIPPTLEPALDGGPGGGRWLAVAALVLFVVVLLGLLTGHLG